MRLTIMPRIPTTITLQKNNPRKFCSKDNFKIICLVEYSILKTDPISK